MADQDASRPYIGYRSAGRRPERNQDRRAAADAPLALLRGWAAGTAGLPGDIEALLRMVTPGVDNTPAFPTSDFYKEWLPGDKLRSTPVGRAATELGSMTGGLGAGTAARGVERAGRMLGRGALEQVARAVESGNPLVAAATPAYVVKPKGGNWLAGSVEEALGPLRSPLGDDLATARDYLANAQRESPELVERYAAEVSRREKDAAMNSWIDKQLSRYVKNELAAPEDPVRALAERGVLHFAPENVILDANTAARRTEAGFPRHGVAKSQLATDWEVMADRAINSAKAGDLINPAYANPAYGSRADEAARYLSENPWLAKVPPETPVYDSAMGSTPGLGFSHLVDELRNALNPASGLPRELLLKYSSLDRLSVPQAVERVAKINEWRAAQKAAADAARASNPATQLFREYPTIPGTELPNERGLRWVELKVPAASRETLDPESQKLYDQFIKEGIPENEVMAHFGQDDAPRAALADALKYEGETMGHCVGGYCEDVASGRSRIYSLRDAKGEPHVTIEVQPGYINPEKWFNSLSEADQLALVESGYSGYNIRQSPAFKVAVDSLPNRVTQIKGKQNRAPKEDYLPFVQDFVKSQQWSDIGDLPNTGLVQLPDKRLITRQQFDEGAQQLMPEGDAPVSTDWLLRQIQRDPDWWERSKGAFEGYATGGLVEHSDPGYNPDRIDALAAQLRTELFA